MRRRAVSELISSLINVTIVLSLSFFIYLYAYSNFYNEIEMFNSIIENFKNSMGNDLIIEHLQFFDDSLILLLGNFGNSNLELEYLKLISNSHEFKIILNTVLYIGESKLFKIYLNDFSFHEFSKIIIFYKKEGFYKVFNITYTLV